MSLRRALQYMQMGDDAWNSKCRSCWHNIGDRAPFRARFEPTSPGADDDEYREVKFALLKTVSITELPRPKWNAMTITLVETEWTT